MALSSTEPAIALITGRITSTSMSFVGLALNNYGSAATRYVVIVPMLTVVVPPIQRSSCGRPDCRRAKVRSLHKKKTAADAVVKMSAIAPGCTPGLVLSH
jgi:hypothetical protein